MAPKPHSLTLVISAALLTLLAAPVAADALIQFDRGIAGARMGNSPAKVRAALGAPASKRSGRNDLGWFLEWRFKGGITVSFQRRRAPPRAQGPLPDHRRHAFLPYRPLHRGIGHHRLPDRIAVAG